MARTESKSIQVHPSDEQSQINLMQRFQWNLLNSQEIKTVDNRLERRGDTIYQTSNTEHYIKLVFNRDLNLPNLDEIKRLEQEFFSLPYPNYPSAFGCFMAIGLFILFAVVWGICAGLVFASGVEEGAAATIALIITIVLSFGSVIGAYWAYFVYSYRPRKEKADQIMAQTRKREQELLEAVAQYD